MVAATRLAWAMTMLNKAGLGLSRVWSAARSSAASLMIRPFAGDGAGERAEFDAGGLEGGVAGDVSDGRGAWIMAVL